jgi:GATA-binding protein, other eukaryote
MKKPVIKRRKRVPAAAAAGASNNASRMSDQAAAEALVAVARLGVENGGIPAGEESEGEAEQPKKKRVRKAKTDHDKSAARKQVDDEDVRMGGMDEGMERDVGDRSGRGSRRKRSRDPNGSSWAGNISDLRSVSSKGAHFFRSRTSFFGVIPLS